MVATFIQNHFLNGLLNISCHSFSIGIKVVSEWKTIILTAIRVSDSGGRGRA